MPALAPTVAAAAVAVAIVLALHAWRDRAARSGVIPVVDSLVRIGWVTTSTLIAYATVLGPIREVERWVESGVLSILHIPIVATASLPLLAVGPTLALWLLGRLPATSARYGIAFGVGTAAGWAAYIVGMRRLFHGVWIWVGS